MKILLSLVLFVLFSTQLFSQKIAQIQYDGLVHISKSVALRMLNFKAGDDIDQKQIDKAIKDYFAQGYFNDIWVEIEGDVLTFYFKEKPIISKVELKGWKEDDKEAIENIVQIKKGTLYNEQKLQEAKKRIIEAISQEGKLDTVVEIETEYLENGSVRVAFLVNEGEEIIINKIRYKGVKQLDPSGFDEVIANKEHQFMGWFWLRNDGKMDLLNLQYDPLRIRDYYMQYGFLDAVVKPPFVRVDFHNYSADMKYEITEGIPYKVRSISFVQTKHVIDEQKLRELLKLKIGKTFNIKTFRADMDRIKTKIADLSYAYVQVIPDLQKDTPNGEVDIVFKIIPGQKVKIHDVIISGNTRTLDRIIRRELYLGPGDMYSLTDLRDSRRALGRLGYFDSTTIEEKRVSDNEMDLVVKVKEAATGSIQAGGGYGSSGGFMLSLAVNDRNIWGSGINLGVKAEKSEIAKSYSLSLSNPRLNDSDFSGNFSIYSSENDYDYYNVYSKGVNVGVGHRFTRFITGYLGYGYSKNKYDVAADINTTLIDTFYFESYDKSSVTVSATFNNTDDYYLPRSGFIFSQSVEKAGLGADAQFTKFKTKFSTYFGLRDYIDYDWVLRYKARLNYVRDGGYLPISEKFYSGGIGTIRGYKSYSLSPTIVDSDGKTRRIGGRKSFANSFELSMPLIPKAKMRLVTYLDWGFIGEDSFTEISRGGYGAGIEWFSPVGPIQLMFSNPLAKKSGDDIAHFEFTIGRRF